MKNAIDNWEHLDKELQQVVNSDLEVVIPCPMCGSQTAKSYSQGTQVEIQCCRFMFFGLQKSDYLNEAQDETFNMMKPSYSSYVEKCIIKISIYLRNKMAKKLQNR